MEQAVRVLSGIKLRGRSTMRAIIVIDDDSQVQKVLEKMLEQEECQVIGALNGN